MSPISVRRIEPPPPPEPERCIYVGSSRIPLPAEDASARQLLDFAALSAFAKDAHPDVFGNNVLYDTASAAARAYFELYPDEAKRAEQL